MWVTGNPGVKTGVQRTEFVPAEGEDRVCGLRAVERLRGEEGAWRASLRFLPVVFWLVALAALPYVGAILTPTPGWDLRVYQHAMQSLLAGHDPYADGIAVQVAFHQQWLLHPDPAVIPPFTYVYSPMTLPLVGLAGRLPLFLAGALYGLAYLCGVVGLALACLEAAEDKERAIFVFLVPAAFYFPGLIYAPVVLSGNLAYLLYGASFGAAVLGWRRGRWGLFYGVVVLASCFKAPMLGLLLIPALSAARQWIKVGVWFAVGLVLFALQPVIWPALFHNYLRAVELQFSYNHDFGLSPSGLLGNSLYALGKPYSLASTGFYVVYGAIVLGVLVVLSRRYLRGEFSLRQWMPVMLVGTVLLNPRIKEYDIAALTVPMALILWRLCARNSTMRWAAVKSLVLFLIFNAIGTSAEVMMKPTMGVLMVGAFVAGVWHLLHPVAVATEVAGELKLA